MVAPKELLLEKQFLILRPSLWTKAETWDVVVVVSGSWYLVVDEETLLVVVGAQQTRNIHHNLKEGQKALVVCMLVRTNWYYYIEATLLEAWNTVFVVLRWLVFVADRVEVAVVGCSKVVVVVGRSERMEPVACSVGFLVAVDDYIVHSNPSETVKLDSHPCVASLLDWRKISSHSQNAVDYAVCLLRYFDDAGGS